MFRTRRLATLAVSIVLSACAGSDGGRAEGSSEDGSSTSGETGLETTETSTSTSTTSASTSSTSTSSTSAPSDDDSTTADDDDTGPACPPGSTGCPCDEGACDGDLVCFEGVCETALQCPADVNEPNDSEADAMSLGTITDCDSSGSSLSGVLSLGDEDWFTYIGDDVFGCLVDPEREIVTDGSLRICKFAECLNGLPNTEITCPPGTQSAMSPAGRPGCCGSSGFKMGVFDCAGTIDDDARIYIRIDQGVPQCTQYTLNYHY